MNKNREMGIDGEFHKKYEKYRIYPVFFLSRYTRMSFDFITFRRCAWLDKYIVMRLFQSLDASPFVRTARISHRRMSRGPAVRQVSKSEDLWNIL